MKVNKQSLVNIFNEMENDGVKITENTNWNFYFFDIDKKKIEKLSKSFLTKKELQYTTSVDEMEDGYWRLKVSIRKKFTAETLYKNNTKFNYLIKDYGIELFDGWDVDV